MRVKVEERLKKLRLYAESCSHNRIINPGEKRGVITSGIAYQYVVEEFTKASILKLGLSFPFPDELIKKFASRFPEVVVVEELDSFLEEHIRSLGIRTKGRHYFSGIGELNPDRVAQGRRKIDDSEEPVGKSKEKEKLPSLPARPPIFCPGCPSMGFFYALSRIDCVVTGDIGCYSLGVFPPYERMDTIVCMGAGITICQGMDKAGLRDRPIIGVVGDSTFFHSGITGLLELSYNQGISTIVVIDNRVTAMTGHQDHPGTGITLKGESTHMAYPEDFARACGIENVRIIDPLSFEETLKVLKEETKKQAPSLIVARRACVLKERQKKTPYVIDKELCVQCDRCLRIGCSAIEKRDGQFLINELTCYGCGFCAQICRKGAIQAKALV